MGMFENIGRRLLGKSILPPLDAVVAREAPHLVVPMESLNLPSIKMDILNAQRNCLALEGTVKLNGPNTSEEGNYYGRNVTNKDVIMGNAARLLGNVAYAIRDGGVDQLALSEINITERVKDLRSALNLLEVHSMADASLEGTIVNHFKSLRMLPEQYGETIAATPLLRL